MHVSIVVPVMNESESVVPLYEEVRAALEQTDRSWELLFVDDGSTDSTRGVIREIAESDQRVALVILRRNYGQTAAMQAGIEHAAGEVIVTIDGDLQNDPQDIPMMLEKLDEGFDLIHGWRKNRQDAFLNRKLPSLLANRLISRVTGFPIHDLGCTLKAMRAEFARELELYGDMHRFIPILASARGARCAEVVTRHRERQFGTTKYGIGRTIRVLLDLITIKFMLDFFDKPMRLFGRLGLFGLAAGAISGIVTVAMKFLSGVDMTGNPLLLMTVLSTLLGAQFICIGLIGEVIVRSYYGARNSRHYGVRECVNVDDAVPSVPFRAEQSTTIRRSA